MDHHHQHQTSHKNSRTQPESQCIKIPIIIGKYIIPIPRSHSSFHILSWLRKFQIMLQVYDFTNISQFKIIPAKSSPYIESVLIFPQFFSQITIEIFGKKEDSWYISVQTPGEDKHIGCVRCEVKWSVITMLEAGHCSGCQHIIMCGHVCLSTVLGSSSNTSNNTRLETRTRCDPGKEKFPACLSSYVSHSHMQCTDCSTMRSIGKLNAKERMEYFFAKSQRWIFIVSSNWCR